MTLKTRSSNFRAVYLFFSSVLIFMLHLPVAFSKPSNADFSKGIPPIDEVVKNEEPKDAPVVVSESSLLAKVYDSLNLNMKGLSKDAFDMAIIGYQKLVRSGKIARQGILSIADFTKSSSKKRLFVIDLKNYKVLFNTYVAHGKNSGEEYAKSFSNVNESLQSSLGFYTTSSTYEGSNGYSMKLNGMENGINDNANSRAIVMHGADYANENFISAKGYLGRSFGCPAVPENMNKPIVDKIKNGTCLFIYANNKSYLKQSRLLRA